MTPEVQIQLKEAKKPWYKSAWFISIAGLVVLWFGIPLILNFFTGTQPAPAINPSAEINLPLSPVPRTSLETADDPWLGSPVAPVVIVEFGDFQCPFCRESVTIIKQVLKKYPEAVKIIYRDFPVVSIHPESVPAAEAANCAARQGKFWQYHDALFDNQDNLGTELYLSISRILKLNEEEFSQCLSQHQTLSEIQADLSVGVSAGINGTPAWFVNGRKVEGVLSLELWQKLIDYLVVEELEQKASQ